MKSMTGYGKGEATANGKTITVELKSVNHRFLDLSIKSPYFLSFAEDYIRKTIQKNFARGHIDCFVTVLEGSTATLKEYTANYKQIDAYLSLANELSEKYGLENTLTVSELLRLPQSLVEKQAEDNQDELMSLLSLALDNACKGLADMREKEGNNLKKVISSHLEVIRVLAEGIQKTAPEVVEQYREKLKQRVTEYLQDVNPDESRLLTEVAVFTDRVNIDEEINRLFSHLSQFYDLLEQTVPVGKKLDFLVQETNRETNTIGSKCNNSEISKSVVDMKNEIEKLREQIQNIE